MLINSGFISPDELYSMIPEYDIYRYYLGFDFKPYKNYKSPFHPDTTPSFGMFITKEKHLFFKDFGGDGYSGDAIKFVSLLKHISYGEAIKEILNDFNVAPAPTYNWKREYSEVIKEEKKRAKIQIIPNRKFLSDEISYWRKYGITEEDLKREDIFSVNQLYIDKQRMWTSGSMVFAYSYQDKNEQYLKIYQPYNKTFKWFSNVPVKRPLNLHKLEHQSRTIVLAKSKKCKMVLNKFLTDIYEVQKEGAEVVSDDLQKYINTHYDIKYCFFDNDYAGLKAAEDLKNKGFIPIIVPAHYNAKDPSDLVDFHGYAELHSLLKNYDLNTRSIKY